MERVFGDYSRTSANHANCSKYGRKEKRPMARTLFRNAQILDAERGDYLAESSVLVEGDRILAGPAERSPAYITARAARVLAGLLPCRPSAGRPLGRAHYRPPPGLSLAYPAGARPLLSR